MPAAAGQHCDTLCTHAQTSRQSHNKNLFFFLPHLLDRKGNIATSEFQTPTKTETFCGFEDPNLCGFTQPNDTSDFFDWDWGHFMYIEASAKGRGKNAIIYSPLYRGLKEQCIDFYYHMNGRHIGTLNVYAKARGAELASVWRAWGNQGDVWSVARLSIPKQLARAGYQIAFEGITENGYQGDMAIDDVSVKDGECPKVEGIQTVQVQFNTTSSVRDGKNFARNIKRMRLGRLRRNRQTRGGN
ncbi:hypothetical protein BaRGS_00000241 [Batillaria attramentaria]|uniref:MAM domain-containing protein n=1 Tax=Batillaria attramentaria TaxID=370345 RepID=A0ABD0MAP4_9CAEN